MFNAIKWGILGAGNIARKFAASLSIVPNAKLVAVGSQSAARAQAFSTEFDVPKKYFSYEALATDPEVDVVYIATRNPFHAENIKLCVNSGKPVLCEKPFTINAIEAAEVITLARKRNVFLMEGMYTRFFPVFAQIRTWLAEERIGKPELLQVDFGIRGDWPSNGRLLNPSLGGGALLDLAIYGVSLSSMIFGSPKHIVSQLHFGKTGVDEQCGIVFRHDDGQLSVLYAAIKTDTRKEACISGTSGQINIHCPFWRPNCVTLTTSSGKSERIELPYQSSGFQFEILEVMNCLRQGRLESQLMPLEETRSIIDTLDRIRAQWNFKYPMELQGQKEVLDT